VQRPDRSAAQPLPQQAILTLQRQAGNAAVTRALLARAEATPAPAASAAPATAAPATVPKGPSDADKTEFDALKGAITDETIEEYLERRRKQFGDKEGESTEYTKYAEIADKEFDGIKNLIGQAEDSVERRKILYRWMRKGYIAAGIADPPATIKAGMSPELKKKLDAVNDKLGGRKPGGFAARPMKIAGDYRLGTLSEHATGKAVDIAPEKNPQLPSAEWKFITTFAGKAPDLSKATWKATPEKVWQGVYDLNEAFKKALKEKVDTATKPADAPKTESPKAEPGTAPKAVAKAPAAAPAKAAPKVPTRKEAIAELLKGNTVLISCINANGEDQGFFELPKDLVVALHGQGLTWGATFSDVDLHHFEMD
jgi:hypothetical protein